MVIVEQAWIDEWVIGTQENVAGAAQLHEQTGGLYNSS